MTHLKRLKVPKSWPLIKRKGIRFIARPMPGPHKFEDSITLNVLLKDVLGYASTTKDSKRILNRGQVLVNNIVKKSPKNTVGILDTISFTEIDEYYRLLYNVRGKFELQKIKKEDTETKLSKIVGKTILKKSKIQLNFHDGTNLLVDKDIYATGDSVVIKNKDIVKHLKLEKGVLVYIMNGKYKGTTGKLESIENSSAISSGKIIITANKEKITTKKEFAFAIEKPFTK